MNNTHINPARFNTLKWVLAVMYLSLFGCASVPNSISSTDLPARAWLESIHQYRDTLPADHPDLTENVMEITQEMRAEVTERFSHFSRYEAGAALTRWLLESDGRAMQYDVHANLSPIEAWEQRKGNCLSFTMLLVALGDELDLNIEFNSVDIPNTWGLDEVGMVYFRHVNGVQEFGLRKRVFDLAMQDYDDGYPQKFISRDQAMALLQNNRAVEFLRAGELERAQHTIKIGIGFDPSNSDLWVNLGVINKRLNEVERAETALLHAFKLDRYNVAAISNLERFYRERGEVAKATRFQKQASIARRANPYFHYQLALEHLTENDYRRANKAIKKALILHDQDPRFYELKSAVAIAMGRYEDALRALGKAHDISTTSGQRNRYMSKVERVVKEAKAAQSAQQEAADSQREALIRQQLNNVQRGMLIN